MDKLRSTNRTKIYLFLCFWFIYLEEYRLYLETMNGTIKSIKFLFKNRTMHAISLLSIYIYIVSTREENPDYFPLWKKFFILSEEWNEIRTKGKFSIEFVSLCCRIGNPREAKSIQLSYARTSSACCSSFSKIKTLERGFFFFFFL